MIESYTPNGLATALALEFDDSHLRVKDLIVKIHSPNRIAIESPANPGGMLPAFAQGIGMLAAHRRTILEQAVAIIEHGTVDFSVHGDEVVVTRDDSGRIDMGIRTEAASYTTLVGRFVKLGLLHQALSEITGSPVGSAQYHADTIAFDGEFIHLPDERAPTTRAPRVMEPLLVGGDKAAAFRLLGEDLEMLMKERVVVGLRTKWARRVAVPMWHAHKAMLDKPTGLNIAHALEVMSQCQDISLRDAVTNSICRTYAIPHQEATIDQPAS